MQHDIFRSGHDLDLRSNFQHDHIRSSYSSFDVYRQKEHDACKMSVVSRDYTELKVITETCVS